MRLLLGMLLSACLAATAQEYSTYIADSNEYHVAKIVADAAGNTYITGYRSIAIPGRTPTTTSDILVTQLDPAGSLVFTVTIGGKGTDQAKDIALDPAGNIYVAGSTSSPNFPLHAPLQSQPAKMGTGFILKLSPDGSRILFSSYFGGTRAMSSVNAIAVDSGGNLYLTGTTFASDYPASPGMKLGPASPVWGVAQYSGAFVAKLPPAADRMLFSAVITGSALTCSGGSSCILGERLTTSEAIGVDAGANITIAGNSNTTDLPATKGALLAGGFGAFVAQFKADGSGLAWLTYLSNVRNSEWFTAVTPAINTLALDSTGRAIIAGSTANGALPGTPAPPAGSGQDAFVAKLQPDGSGIVWATLLGGTGTDAAQAIALDPAGDVWVAGTTTSPDFPNTNGWSTGSEFLTGFKPDGSALLYAAQLPAGTVAQSIAISSAGLIHMAGVNGLVSAFTPGQTAAPRILGLGNSAYASALSGRIAPGELISIYGPHIGVTDTQVAIGGTPAPVLYVSDSQINVIVPFEVAGQSTAHLSVFSKSAALPDFPVIIADAVPRSSAIRTAAPSR